MVSRVVRVDTRRGCAIEKGGERKKEREGRGELVSARRDGQDRRRALANCALKWWKIGEREGARQNK